jgi:hypothetical protein
LNTIWPKSIPKSMALLTISESALPLGAMGVSLCSIALPTKLASYMIVAKF